MKTALLTGGTKVIHGSFVVSLYITDNKPKRAVYNNIYIIYILSHTNVIHLIYMFFSIS